jgi:integrase/recombinase XerD
MPRTGALILPGQDPMAPHLLAAAAFLMQYTNRNTREAYALDLRQYFAWCHSNGLDPMQVRRFHIQAYAIYLTEQRGNGPATVSRNIGTIGGYYIDAVLNDYIPASPVIKIKTPKVHDDPRKKTWLTRFELAALLRAAKASSSGDWAMVSLMATIGMRVQAVCDVRIEHIKTTDIGYRILETVGKGGKPSLKVLPIPVAQAIDAAIGGRQEGFLLRRRDGSQMTRRSADVVVKRLTKAAGLTKPVSPHVLRRSCATNLLKNGVDIRVVQEQLDHASSRVTLEYDAVGVEIHAQASHTMAAMLASSS